MSFQVRDLMIDVLPAKQSPALRGLQACSESTRNEEEDEAGCADNTRPPEKYTAAAQAEMDLAVLRHELREVLSQPAAGRP